MAHFPAQPEQLSAAWLTEILRAAKAVAADEEVADFTVASIGDGVGLLGMVVRLELTYRGGTGVGPESLVIKFAHPVPANRAIAMNLHMYEREVTFFTKIADSVDVPKPVCYHAEVDTDTGENVVVLEDLRRYRAADQVAGVNADDAKLVIDAFVPLHAAYWGNTDHEMLHSAMRIDSNYIEAFMPGVEGTWENCVQQFGDCITEDVKAALPRYMSGMRQLHGVMGRRTQTLVHGDVRMDNVMFGSGGDLQEHPVVLIDWQALMVSNPMHDMAYMVSQSLSVEDRRAHEDELVQHYHARLGERGVRDYSIEQCWDDYDVAVLYLLSYPLIIGGAFDPANDRGRQLAEEVLRRSSQTVSDRGLLARIPE